MNNTPFYIARRYLIAKKGNTAVTIITWLAALAVMIGVTAMFIILSVFSGLEGLNAELIANVHPDISITSEKGKTISNIERVNAILKKNRHVAYSSRVIEEKVYVSYNNIGEIAYLRGVDSSYIHINPIHEHIVLGNYPSFNYINEVAIENGLDSRLSIQVGDNANPALLLMPKSGTGIINKEEEVFNKKEVYASGIFYSSEQMNNYLIAPIELSQQLLDLPKDAAYEIVVKLKNHVNAEQVKEEFQRSLGKGYVVLTKNEQNAAFWKMINTEKMMIYLIFSLVIFITTFNLAGAIVILQLDKKAQSNALISLGFTLNKLRLTYFYTGFLITFFGLFFGLILGTIVCYFQMKTGTFMASENLPFPVNITFYNYLIVATITLVFGGIVSWIFSRVNKNLIRFK